MKRCTHCDLNRRDFIRIGFGAAAGGVLASKLGLAFAQEAAAGRAQSVILLWLQGAASQFETWDPKPGVPAGGPTKAIDTGRGFSISDNLPKMARLAEHYSLIRTLHSKDPNHDTARYLLHTAHRRIDTVDYPHLGSLISTELGMKAEGLPGCVAIGGDDGIGAGYLSPDQSPFIVEKIDKPLEDIELAAGITRFRLEDREALLQAQNVGFKKEHDERKVVEHQKAYERALALIRSPHIKAFDTAREPEAVRALYGDGPFGRACLMARRLVEAGTRFVEVRLGDWDTHSDNFARTKGLCDQLDGGFSALLTDLARTSMLKSTLVLCLSEFGRTPIINANNGRDHFSRAWSGVVAGGGLPGGRVVGETSADGVDILKRPVTVNELYATLYGRLGIDQNKKYMTPQGRPIQVLESGVPIPELS